MALLVFLAAGCASNALSGRIFSDFHHGTLPSVVARCTAVFQHGATDDEERHLAVRVCAVLLPPTFLMLGDEKKARGILAAGCKLNNNDRVTYVALMISQLATKVIESAEDRARTRERVATTLGAGGHRVERDTTEGERHVAEMLKMAVSECSVDAQAVMTKVKEMQSDD